MCSHIPNIDTVTYQTANAVLRFINVILLRLINFQTFFFKVALSDGRLSCDCVKLGKLGSEKCKVSFLAKYRSWVLFKTATKVRMGLKYVCVLR